MEFGGALEKSPVLGQADDRTESEFSVGGGS